MPKFKTGQTVLNTRDDCEHIIVGTNEQIASYSNYFSRREEYNDSDGIHTLYWVFTPINENYTWIWENGFKSEPYCTNKERGRLILKQHENQILSFLRIRNNDSERFIKDFLTPPCSNVIPESPLQPEHQVISSETLITIMPPVEDECEEWDYYDLINEED